MASEHLWGMPDPDIAEAAEVAAWRAGHAGRLSKGPEAVMEQVAASNVEFDGSLRPTGSSSGRRTPNRGVTGRRKPTGTLSGLRGRRKPNHDPHPEVTAMTLTINDTTMTSDQTTHTARH